MKKLIAKRKLFIAKGFTIIEVLVAITITTIFISIFVQMAVPIKNTLAKNILELESYNRLLILTSFLDSAVEDSEVVIGSEDKILSIYNRTSTDIVSGDPNITCGVFPDVTLSCKFFRLPGDEDDLTLPMISLLTYGTSTLSLHMSTTSDQYRMFVGKYIVQFGLFPHVHINE